MYEYIVYDEYYIYLQLFVKICKYFAKFKRVKRWFYYYNNSLSKENFYCKNILLIYRNVGINLTILSYKKYSDIH